MKPVRRLPSEVCSLVRSGVVIPTPSQAVVELVLNSIDAGATSIAIRVDLRIFKIQVVDNGHGITSEDLQEIGNRSVTSKCYTLEEFYTNLMYHGYRGESLASLREMCGLLEIVTRCADSNCTYSKVFIHGQEERVKISDLNRPANGTTVTITDFMFNMPVRRERMKQAIELEAIRSCIECIALAHPEISLSIRNDAKGRIIMEKLKSSDLVNAFEHLFGHNLARMLAAINFSTEKFKISGYISKEPYRHNDLQFIFVNRQPIIKTKLHKLVTALLSKSSIVRNNGPWKNKPIPKDVPVERWLSFSSLEKNKKFAVFVINITCARKEYEMCWDSKKPMIYFKDWEGIIACVSNAIREFLKLESLVDDDVEHETTEDETGNYISPVEGKSQLSQTSLPSENLLKVNHQKDLGVETWNMQGAIHGIYAKRPREIKMKLTTDKNVENDNQKTDSINEIKTFWTPDTTNTNQECLQNEQDSVPPVVEFLRKYETPPAARLQITEGAYRLKQKEDEERKRAIAKKLGAFAFSKKPKLTSIKNCQNVDSGKLTCTKTLKNVKEQSFLLPKSKEHKHRKKLYNKVSGPPSDSLKMGKHDKLCSNSKNHDQINGNVPQKQSRIYEDNESFENMSNYFSRSSSLNCDTKANTTLSTSSDIFSFTTEKVSPLESEDSNGITLCNDSEKLLSHSPNEETNAQVNDSFHQSFMKSVNSCKHPLYSDKSHGSAFSPNKNYFVLEHSSSSSTPSDVKDTYVVKNDIVSGVSENAKSCANLGISKMLVVSIPTPQSKSPVESPASFALLDKSHSNKSSLRTQVIFADNSKNNFLNEPSSFVNICKSPSHNDGHKADIIDNLFACHEDNFSDVRQNSNKQNPSIFIPSSLVNKSLDNSRKPAECSHNESNAEMKSVPCFAPANRGKDEWSKNGVGDQVNTLKQTNVSNLKNVGNFRNMFETFEKHVTPNNITESRSPYFTFKNTSVNCKESVKSHNFYLENMDKTDSSRSRQSNNNKREESCELLSVFDVSDTSQHLELFPAGESKENTEKEINVDPIVNFSFSGCSQERNSEISTKQLQDIDISKIPSQTRASDLTHCNEHEENFSNAIDIRKRIQLWQNKNEMLSNEEKRFSVIHNTEEVLKEDGPFESCVTSECQNTRAFRQTDSILQTEEQFQKETENCVDEIMDKDWLQVRNLEGKLFYFHTPSGFTTFNVPFLAKDSSIYSMSKRSEFLPKGMSPLLTLPTTLNSTSKQRSDTNVSGDASYMTQSSSNNDDLKTVKWRNKPDISNNDISDVLRIAEEKPNKKTFASNTSIPDMFSVTSKMCTLLLTQKLDKRIFSNIRVVGQLDNKFIVTLCSEDKTSNPHILGIFDQHAAHERVRLEALMKAYSSNQDEWSFAATDLNEPVVLIVSSKESHIMSSFQSKFEKLGLHFSLIHKDNVKIHKVPTCLYTRFLRERSSQWLEDTLRILIQDIVAFLIKTGGEDLVVPEVFKDVINSEACKGAIKFGDILSLNECESLLSELSKCDLPFYCAHGRPSFMPLFDLREFEEQRRKHIQRY